MKKGFLIALALFALLAVFVSCEKEAETVDTTESPEISEITTEESEEDAMLSFDPKDYIIIYPGDAYKEKYLAILSSTAIGREYNVSIDYRADTTAERECEILIGKTNRPESQKAFEMLGENDIIIAVINKKIIISATSDDLYDAAAFRFMSALKDGALPSDLCIIENTTTLNKVADSFGKNSSLSFTAAFAHKNSSLEIRIGEGYVVEFTPTSVALYRQEKKRVELAKKVVLSQLEYTYNVHCHFDGEYLRAYFWDPALNMETWQIFEVKTPDLAGEVRVGDPSGYGTVLSSIDCKEMELIDRGATYQNNVIMSAADPDILYHEGYYYMYVTGNHYPVYRSADLANWEYVGVSLPEVSWNIDKRYMWAPDVEYIGGKFYMAVSMGEAGFGIAVADKPEGPFVCAGDMPFLTKTIDGHIFVDDDGKIYLYYTSWCDGRAYGIWGLEMESDCLTPKWETEKLIFTPTEDWEKTMNRGGVVEAPYMLKKEGVYYLVYSGSHFEADYAVGYATSTNPLEGFKKSEHNPILRGTADTRGTGHCSIIETHTGGMVMVYHTHNTPTAVQPRHVAIDPVRFVKTADGYRLEVCGPTTSKVPLDIFN